MASENSTRQDQRDLIRKRGSIKSKLTTYTKFVEACRDSEKDVVHELLLRTATIEKEFDTFQTVQEALELVASDDEYETRLNERSEFENQYFKVVALAKEITQKQKQLRDQVDQSQHGLQPSGLTDPTLNMYSPLTIAAETQVKLPTMHLPKFSGTYEAWPGFSDAFRSAIHDNPNFRDVQRLIYLKSCLIGKAAEKVESLETTTANYAVAWNILEKHYNDPSVVINNRIQAFFELPVCTKFNSSALGELTDVASKHYNALKALNKPFFEAFPVYAITSKLDEQTRLRWKEKTQGNDLPTMEELLDFLHKRCRVLEIAKVELNKPLARPHTNPNMRKRGSSNSHGHTLVHSVQTAHCHVCKGKHFTQYCQTLTNANIEQRKETVRKAGLCTNCLRPDHTAQNCSSGLCKQCNGKHHTLLHQPQQSVQANVSTLSAVGGTETILSTAIINIRDKKGRLQPCRVLLDSGSQSHFITERFANRLGLPQERINIPVIGINNTASKISNTVRATMHSRINNFKTELTFLILPRITEILPTRPISKSQLAIPRNIPLADPQFDTPSEVDALIGAEMFFKLLCVGQLSVANKAITLQKTKVGWVIAGRVPSEASSRTIRCHVACTLDEQLAKFWELEESSKEIAYSADEQASETQYVQTTTRDPVTGGYTVKLPFKTSTPTLGESYAIALRRFRALERTLAKNPKMKRDYTQFLTEYHQLGHMSKLETSNTEEGYYLPHHAIQKTDSVTTKLRVVFDASAKSSNGISLNDTLLVGPTIQEELYALLIRFRTHTYVMTADITKMYRQVTVHPQDRIYQKILWRENPDQPIDTYTLNTVTYGTSAAPFLAIRTLKQLAIDEGDRFPRAARVLREDFYVDDLLTGTDSYNEAAATIDEIRALCARGGFQLRQWATNDETLITALDNKTDETHLKLDLDKTIKTLGIFWNARTDTIAYSVKDTAPINRATKRIILSKIATLFDPLGLLGPIIIRAKLIMQALWKLHLDWDESVPAEIHTEWMTYWQELQLLRNFETDRHILQRNYTSIQLHGFCDASERAYGACIYLRSIDQHGKIVTRLVSSKSRVAPLKVVTLPRLELCAAHILSKLYTTVRHALRHISFDKTIFWSDSTVALHWLKSPPNTLKTFVSHRVADIQTATSHCEWRHISSSNNPADLISRGMRMEEFIQSKLWHNGPTWFTLHEEHWPRSQLASIEIPELRPIIALTAQIIKPGVFERFSSFRRLKRVLAYVFRFANNTLKKKPLSGPLATFELRKAEARIVLLVQQQTYSREIQELRSSNHVTSLSSLTPFLDADGLLRVGGRLSRSNLPYREKHPLLLHKNHCVTKLIVREAHLRNLHAGIQGTLNAVRKTFWVPQGKGLVRQIIHECIKCHRAKPTPTQHIMGDLPASRVTYARPFAQCGVDFCGPLFIKEKLHRNRAKIKVYLAIFICFTTRAIHIEIVSDLTTESFLAALRRFFSRRGKCSDIYSDNATNFVGANRELKQLYSFLSNPESSKSIVESLANEQINWHFIPPRSPHFGGIWEAAVKSVKYHLVRVIGETLLSFEGLLTLIADIEAILNARPLTPVSSDPNDLTAITPGHFLIGESLMNIPDHDFTNLPDGRLSSWQHIQKLKQHFWKRWRTEYLQELTVRKKWHACRTQQIPVGTMVVVQEDNTPPMQWPLGRITAIHPGEDGIIRVVTVRTARGEYKRSVKRIAPLPIEQS